MNQYRCETCKHYHDETEDQYGMCYAESAHREAMYNNTYDHVVKYGCASHSDFQSERDEVLDRLDKEIKEYSIYWLQQSGYEALVYLQKELRQAGEP